MVLEHNTFPRAMSLAVHELRTPVTVVAGYLRMLLKEQGGPLTEKQRKMLEEAERSCGRVSALVAEMSELGKLEANELALARHEFDLAALLAELARGMHEGRDRGVELELRGVERPITVVGDRARIGAAMRALLQATLRERGEPGIVVTQCTPIAGRAPAVVVAIGSEADLPALTGGAEAPPAFDEWRGGLGLALPVARRVIEAHGGRVWSAPGEHARAGSAARLPLAAGRKA